MTRKKRLTIAITGSLIFFTFLLKEFLFPEQSRSQHAVALYLYAGGMIVMIFYLVIAYRSNKDT